MTIIRMIDDGDVEYKNEMGGGLYKIMINNKRKEEEGYKKRIKASISNYQ